MTRERKGLSRRTFGHATLLGTSTMSMVLGGHNKAQANISPAFGMKRGYADGPYGQVHYRDVGEGRPLFMFHQSPMTSRQFDNVYGLFAARGIRAIGIDTPGFGMSDPTDFVPTVEDWAKAVPWVMDHLNIDVADMLGHHTGCYSATEVAIQFPDRVRNLVMAGAIPRTEEQRQTTLKGVEEREINFVYEHDGSHLMNSFATRYRMYGDGADPRLITRYVIEKFMGTGPFWYGHYAAAQYDLGAKLPMIKHRTLIITNTGDVIYEGTKLIKQMRPDFDYVELEGGGVDIVDQQPEAWVDAVVKFLEVESVGN